MPIARSSRVSILTTWIGWVIRAKKLVLKKHISLAQGALRYAAILHRLSRCCRSPGSSVPICGYSDVISIIRETANSGHSPADSNAAITKGIVALVLSAVQDRPAAEVAAADIAAALAPFDLKNQLSSNRTQGVPNMIALIRGTAARYVG